MTARFLLAGAGVAALSLAGLAMARLQAHSADASPAAAVDAEPLPVNAVTVGEVAHYDRQRTYTGVLRAQRRSQLSFNRSNRVTEVLVDQGATVVQGQPLARLDTRSLQAQQRRLQAQIAQAAATLAELEAGPRAEVIAAQRSLVADWEAQVALFEARMNRRERLMAENAVSRADFEDAAFGLDSRKSRLAAERSRLSELVAGTRPEQIDAQRAALQALEASLADVEVELQDSVLQAPYDGVITQRYVDEGTTVAVAEPIFRIVERAPLEAAIGLPPQAAQSIAVGQTFQLRIGDRDYPAEATAIVAELDETTRTRSVILALQEASEPNLVPGHTARLTLPEPVEATGLRIPTTALVRGGRGLWSVYALSRATDGAVAVQRRDVELLYADDDNALVRGLLQAGDQIVADGTHRLVDGQRVTVVPPTPGPAAQAAATVQAPTAPSDLP